MTSRTEQPADPRPPMHIREARPGEHGTLLDIWLRSVRATHDFLSESDIAELTPVVRDSVLPELELWVLCDADDLPIGFMGLSEAVVEALFLSPDWFRRGGGRRLLDHARERKGPLSVDVNEQNPDAVEFYLANGFTIVGRSEQDGAGRPFPLLHLKE